MNIEKNNLNTVDINTDDLRILLDQYKSINNEIRDLNKDIRNDTDSVKEYWSNKTSESVYAWENEFYEKLEDYADRNDLFMSFLERVVNNMYETNDNSSNDLVDSNLKEL